MGASSCFTSDPLDRSRPQRRTDDFDGDYAAYRARGVRFVSRPATHAYGKVAVFEDLYGNLWDLVQFAEKR